MRSALRLPYLLRASILRQHLQTPITLAAASVCTTASSASQKHSGSHLLIGTCSLTLAALILSEQPANAQQPSTHHQHDRSATDPLLAAALGLQEEEKAASDRDRAASQQGTSTSQPSSTKGKLQGPWITDPELDAALPQRALAESKLYGYMHMKQREWQEWLDRVPMMHPRLARDELHAVVKAEAARLEEEVNRTTNLILYNLDDPTARRYYLEAHGCTKPSDAAVKECARYGPVLEMGAGLGHWAAALAKRRVDVVAYDSFADLPLPDLKQDPVFHFRVQKGDTSVIAAHPNRTLLIVYPGPNDMAAEALQQYKGSTLLYVGESRGGVNANDAFFDGLQAGGWECTKVVAVEPFPGGFEKLWVLQKKGARRGWLW